MLDRIRIDYRTLMRWILSPPDHKSTPSLNWDLSEMIATDHQGVITVKIKTHRNASGALNRDPTAAVSMRISTWHHLTCPIAINGCDLTVTVRDESFSS